MDLFAYPISKYRTASPLASIPYLNASPLKSQWDWKLLFPVPLLGFSSKTRGSGREGAVSGLALCETLAGEIAERQASAP